MKHSRQHIRLISLLLMGTLVACSTIPEQAYFKRGDPEGLLDLSSEVVNFQLTSFNTLDTMVDWLNQDQPSRAELYCMDDNPLCINAQSVLEQFAVPVTFVASSDNLVSLVYERVLARDCENRFIDNNVNPYHLNHPTYGCSLAVNMVQMVSDRYQFTSPALLDHHDGERAAQVMEGVRQPNDFTPPEVDPNFESLFDVDTGS